MLGTPVAALTNDAFVTKGQPVANDNGTFPLFSDQSRSCVCPICERSFVYLVGRGMDRKYCSGRCQNKARKIKLGTMKLAKCKVEGCDKLANRIGAGLCEACYMRLRRNGDTALPKPPRGWSEHSSGYKKLKKPDHPLAGRNGEVFEHRVVLFDLLGDGKHPCHWCGRELEWSQIAVDHLDENKKNNAPENLVVSCTYCNRQRGAVLPFVKVMTPVAFEEFIVLLRGYRETCEKSVSPTPLDYKKMAADCRVSRMVTFQCRQCKGTFEYLRVGKGPNRRLYCGQRCYFDYRNALKVAKSVVSVE